MRTFVLALLAVSSFDLRAQTPYLVKDINTTYSYGTYSSSPSEFVALQNRIVFVATTDATGKELWVTEGGTTTLVADLIPGNAGSDASLLNVLNDAILFTARTVDHGFELWATDGTAANTRRVADIFPGPSSSFPSRRVLFGNRALFTATDDSRGRELWITDGTAAGTRVVKDINPGIGSSNPGLPVQLGNFAYFSASNALWKTDGTEAGTVKVADVAARQITRLGNQLLFEGSAGGSNWEPWVSDGTANGTHLLAEILSGPVGSLTRDNIIFAGFTILGSRAVFFANDGAHGREPWISDGTADGTRLIRDLIPGSAGLADDGQSQFVAFGGRAYFSASDTQHGTELWSTDGTEAGTVLFADMFPGTASSYPRSFVVAGANIFFTASVGTPVYRPQLAVTDGTAAGTRLIGAGSPVTTATASAIGSTLYFAGSTVLTGTEPWLSDGTNEGTRMIANLAADDAPSSSPRLLAAADGLLYFFAREGRASESGNPGTSLWRSDGTSSGTFKLLETGTHTTGVTTAGTLAFFKLDAYSEQLMTDGTVAGTKSADEFLTRFAGGELNALYQSGDKLFARVARHEPQYETELWLTTPDLNAHAIPLGIYNPAAPVEVAGRHFLIGRNLTSISGEGLWATDGTAAGSQLVLADLHDDFYGTSSLAGFNGEAYFLREFYPDDGALWKSDGSPEGTVSVAAVPVGSLRGVTLETAGRKLFFMTSGGLWVSDGTAAGTVRLADVQLTYENPDLVATGSRVVYVQQDSSSGYELWASDGTAGGTGLLCSLSASEAELTSVNGLVYFATSDAEHGREIWVTDGTVEGTRLLADVNPGPANSSPADFTQVGNLLYFTANTDGNGRELWALPLTDTLLSIADARATEGSMLRFRVSLTRPSAQTVSVSYATSDRTAHATEDYAAQAGAVTFAPGETTKFIEIPTLSDTTPETANELLFVSLQNANGAGLLDRDATGVVEDDDQFADLSIPTLQSSPDHGLTVMNAGPSMATSIAVTYAMTPALAIGCHPIPYLASGASAATPGVSSSSLKQRYASATVSGAQADPNPSNNTTSWTTNTHGSMIVMNAAYLTPGASATVYANYYGNPAATSSDPTVVTVTPVTKIDSSNLTFTVTALKTGSAFVKLESQGSSLLVLVSASGTTPRWPGGMSASTLNPGPSLDEPVILRIARGTAPFTQSMATGTVTVTISGQEIARHTLSGTEDTIPIYFRNVGTNVGEITYSGDANFLPETMAASFYISKGHVTITGTLEQAGTAGTYALNVRVTGSPVVAPEGSVAVLNGATEIARIALQPQSDNSAVAQTTLNGLTPNSTLTLTYIGNALYNSASQQIRTEEPRRRSVRH